jgi:hypothetical protein
MVMKARLIAVFAAGALFLAGCGGGADDGAPAITDEGPTPTAAASSSGDDSGGDGQAAGDVDCSKFSKEDVAKFAIWAQLFAQVRTADALKSMTITGYSPEEMAALLDSLDQLKGHEGEVYGKPNDALVVFRKGNDIYAAAIAKGDSATDEDLAGLDDLEPDVQSWIKAQASVLATLDSVCPDLA